MTHDFVVMEGERATTLNLRIENIRFQRYSGWKDINDFFFFCPSESHLELILE